MLTMAVEIPKEQVPLLKFPTDEVLPAVDDRNERSRIIHQATALGNLEKHKVVIVFSDFEGVKKVHTTIWAQTDRKVVLKGGVHIPVNRIHYVNVTP